MFLNSFSYRSSKGPISLYSVSALLSVISCGDPNLNQDLSLPSSEGAARVGYINRDGQVVKISYTLENGNALVGGDTLIPLSDVKSSADLAMGLATEQSVKIWPNGIVPYDASEIKGIYDKELAFAISEWKKASISWVPRKPSDKIYAKFRPILNSGDCGRAPLGLWDLTREGERVIELPSRSLLAKGVCNPYYVMLHEMGHMLGFMHEHQRIDRDNFVKFTGSIVGKTWLQKLDGTASKEKTQKLSNFDFQSVMMYATENTVPNMVRLDGSEIKLNCVLSKNDIEAAARLYKLTPKNTTPTVGMSCGVSKIRSQLAGPNQCVDVIPDATKDKITMSSCGNYSGQAWTSRLEEQRANGENIYTLRTTYTGTGKCLGVVANGNVRNIRMINCSNTSAQQWSVSSAGNGYSRIKNLSTRACLELTNNAAKNTFHLSPCGNSLGQNLRLE